MQPLKTKHQYTDAATHTPGPWHCDGISEYTGELLIRAANGDTVARVCCYGPQSDAPHAQQHNAALISAAPELLEALAGLVRYFDGSADDWHPARHAVFVARRHRQSHRE